MRLFLIAELLLVALFTDQTVLADRATEYNTPKFDELLKQTK